MLGCLLLKTRQNTDNSDGGDCCDEDLGDYCDGNDEDE